MTVRLIHQEHDHNYLINLSNHLKMKFHYKTYNLNILRGTVTAQHTREHLIYKRNQKSPRTFLPDIKMHFTPK